MPGVLDEGNLWRHSQAIGEPDITFTTLRCYEIRRARRERNAADGVEAPETL